MRGGREAKRRKSGDNAWRRLATISAKGVEGTQPLRRAARKKSENWATGKKGGGPPHVAPKTRSTRAAGEANKKKEIKKKRNAYTGPTALVPFFLRL